MRGRTAIGHPHPDPLPPGAGEGGYPANSYEEVTLVILTSIKRPDQSFEADRAVNRESLIQIGKRTNRRFTAPADVGDIGTWGAGGADPDGRFEIQEHRPVMFRVRAGLRFR